jgi:hypothetical protein
MVEWGPPWGLGVLWPPSYIVKKCPGSKCYPPYFHEDKKQKSQSTRDRRNTY